MRFRRTASAMFAAISTLAFGACGRPGGETDAVTLAALAEKADSVGTFRFTAEVDYPEATEGTMPDRSFFETHQAEDARLEGQADVDDGYSWFSAPGLDGPAIVLAAGERVALLRSDLFPASNRPATRWVSFAGVGPMLRHLPAGLTDGWIALGAAPADDPTGMVKKLRNQGGELERDGTENIRGDQTTRYRLNFDVEEFRRSLLDQFDEAMKAVPADADTEGFDREEYRKSLAEMEPPPTTVWVDGQGQLRRMETSAGAGPDPFFDLRVELYDFGAATDIPRPAKEDITSADTLGLPEPAEASDDGLAFPTEEDEPADFAVARRSTLSIRPVLEDRAGDCSQLGDPYFAGKDDGAVHCYRLAPPALDRPMLQAYAASDGEWYVLLKFAPADAEAFDQVASDHVGERLALVVDDEVLSAPTVQTANFAGQIRISGSFTEADAKALASRILD